MFFVVDDNCICCKHENKIFVEDFVPFHLVYAFIKTFLFAFILATVPAYHGYYMKGGALEVGEASTTSFVWTSVVIIITNYVVTQLLLS